MTSYLEKVRQSSEISRRGFVKASAAATAALAVGGLAGCAPNKVKPTKDAVESALAPVDGTWVTAACWHNCGGRCLNKALVKDGVVLRQKTDDTHEDSPEYPQQRACIRGRSQRKQVFADDRIKYPLKRKGWSPDNPNGQLRGIDEWERISWDEALTYVADELKKAKDKYGNNSIFCQGAEIGRTLSAFGGYTSGWGTTSYGTWKFTPGHIGFDGMGDAGINDRFDIWSCETIVFIGGNPAWSSAGNPAYMFLQAKKAGAKFIGVDPHYNETYNLLDAEWVPCRPGQDVALLLGVAYVLINEDSTASPLIDWDYLNKCTIGFDAEHMPEGEDPAGNFKDYVLGTYDGTPKTAEWASERCGASPEQISWLAHEIAPSKKVAILPSWSTGRNHNADSLPQMIMTIGAMTGHMGKPGHMTGLSTHGKAGNNGPDLVKAGKDGIEAIKNPVDDALNYAEMWTAIVEGSYHWNGVGGNLKAPCEVRPIDIHVIYHAGRCLLQTNDGMNKGIEAHRKVDFVVTHAQFLTTNAKYSDIILPLDTYWERPGGFLTGNREMIIMYTQVVEPLYEGRSDQWIACELAKKLALDDKQVYPFDEKQQFFNQIAGAQVLEDDGKTWATLVTITDDDIKNWGVEGKSQEGKIALEELKEKGVYQVERKPGDNYGHVAYEAFVADPAANPLETSESGKQEIYSRALAKRINDFGYSEIKPIPTYIAPEDGFEDTFADFAGKAKGDYPFQVCDIHYLRRSHTVFDNIPWLREAWSNPVFLNPDDASAQGIAAGDTVILTSPHGQTLRQVSLTGRVMPGVIMLPHGAWVDKDDTDVTDTAGADNILCGAIPTGQGTSGWNTCIARVEKYGGTALMTDAEKPQRIVAGE